MNIPDMQLPCREHSGIRVEKAVNGFIIHTTADTNYVRGMSLVAASIAELALVLEEVQYQQRMAILGFFDPQPDGGSDAEEQLRHEKFMRVAKAV